jgi:hypothetical protein
MSRSARSVTAAEVKHFSVSFSIFPLRPTPSVGFSRPHCRPAALLRPRAGLRSSRSVALFSGRL